MDHRLPSSLAVGERSSIRRRSGGIDKTSRLFSASSAVPQSSTCVTTARTLQSGSDNISTSPDTLLVQVEDTDVTDGKSALLLVHSAAVELSRSSYDQLHPNLKHLPQLPHGSPYPNDSNPSFSDVPLTPRLQRSSPDNDLHQFATSMSRLPTPDFSKSKPLFSLSRLLSRHSQQDEPPATSHSSPPSIRRASEATPQSCESRSSAGLSRCPSLARPALISSSSGNYTQKWPKPRLNPRAIGGLVAALDDSDGLGMDTVDRWTIHKWILLISVIIVFMYSCSGLICALLTWFRGWEHADVMYVADGDILVLITVAASILLFTSLVGMCGTFLNSRPILAIYSLLLWSALISLAAVGYTTYRRSAFSLDRKLNLAWSQWYNPASRLMIQDSLRCCGYYNALHEAVSSRRCFPRTTLPGCKGKLYRFERYNLEMIWSTVFSLVPLHLVVMFVSLLCSNHVTKRFGKGITPRRYRLSAEDVKVDEDGIISQFKNSGIISKPPLSRSSANAIFREDKAERWPLLSVEE